MRIRTVLIDDEWPALQLHRTMLQESQDFEIVGAFQSPGELLAGLDQHRADLYLLDIDMPEMSGIQLTRKIKKVNAEAHVIFLTAYPNYALNAYEVEALDYLLKPLSGEQIRRISQRISRMRPRPEQQPTPAGKKLRAFGGLHFENEDGTFQRIKWRSSKAEELFCFFLVNQPHPLSADLIMDTIWPDAAGSGKNVLHISIYRMKTALKQIGIHAEVEIQQGRYFLKMAPLWVDVHQVEALFRQEHPFTEEQSEQIKEVLKLYQGPLFGDRDYHWCVEYRESLTVKVLDLQKKIIRLDAAAKRWGEVKRRIIPLLNWHPYDEELHVTYLHALHHLNEKDQFEKHLKHFRAIMVEELGIQPDAVLRAVFNPD